MMALFCVLACTMTRTQGFSQSGASERTKTRHQTSDAAHTLQKVGIRLFSHHTIGHTNRQMLEREYRAWPESHSHAPICTRAIEVTGEPNPSQTLFASQKRAE